MRELTPAPGCFKKANTLIPFGSLVLAFYPIPTLEVKIGTGSDNNALRRGLRCTL